MEMLCASPLQQQQHAHRTTQRRTLFAKEMESCEAFPALPRTATSLSVTVSG